MFSFHTLHVLCELRKFLPKYRIMWPMPSYLFWNLAILFSNSSLGSEKLNQNRHSLIKSRLTDLNNFIRKRVTAKSCLTDSTLNHITRLASIDSMFVCFFLLSMFYYFIVCLSSGWPVSHRKPLLCLCLYFVFV